MLCFSIISFGFQGLNPRHQIYFQYNRPTHKCYLVFEGKLSEIFDLTIKDGDTIGVIFIYETNEFGITLNGDLKGKEVLLVSLTTVNNTLLSQRMCMLKTSII